MVSDFEEISLISKVTVRKKVNVDLFILNPSMKLLFLRRLFAYMASPKVQSLARYVLYTTMICLPLSMILLSFLQMTWWHWDFKIHSTGDFFKSLKLEPVCGRINEPSADVRRPRNGGDTPPRADMTLTLTMPGKLTWIGAKEVGCFGRCGIHGPTLAAGVSKCIQRVKPCHTGSPTEGE